MQRRTAAAAKPCCSAARSDPVLPAQSTTLLCSRRGSRVVARDSPYREDPGSNAPDNGSSRQHEAHPDRFHELPPDQSLEAGSTPNTPADSSDATLDNLKAVLPSAAAGAAQGSTPQAIAAAQALQRGEGLPKHVTAPAGQKLQSQLEEMASKYDALGRRLDSMEGTLLSLLRSVKERAARPAAAAAVGPGGEAAADGAVVAVAAAGEVELPEGELEALGDAVGGDEDDDDEHGGRFDLKKLQTSLSENINRGYLESVKHLREMLMAYEWHLHGKELAERRGVALFERHCAEHDLGVSFDTLTALYADPNDLSVLTDDKLKLLARSIIQTAVDERYCSIYYECTATAKELAHTGLKDVIPDSAGKVGGVIKDMLPLPGFLKSSK
uniref:Uncharacterized protein n=1 Tax=Tetradesmus obliquus TaxID=3088 RepID=A0A383W597_TETOB|eukprot:jgi/Sobl393_1/17082/SZX72400.1